MVFSERSRVLRTVAVLSAAVMAVITAAGCTPPPTTPGPGHTASIKAGGEVIGVTVPNGLTVTVSSAKPATLPPTPAGMSFPFGALAITVKRAKPGSVVLATITLQQPVVVYRKVIEGAWGAFDFDGTTGATVSADGKTITLRLQDGGRGDDDGVANGTITDPGAGGVATSLTITSGDVPTLTFDQPFSYQIPTAGADGPVSWSVLWGTLPDGVSLDSTTGTIHGTPTMGTEVSDAVKVVQVQATDASTSTTQLLALLEVPAPNPQTSTGAPLPDGNGVFFYAECFHSGCFPNVSRYDASGVIVPVTTFSVGSLRDVPLQYFSAVNHAETEFVSPDVGPDGTSYGSGPVTVRDATTGQVVATLEASTAFQMAGGRFSPNDRYMTLSDSSGVTQVLDTSNWSVLRTLDNGIRLWSPDSTELLLGEQTVTPGQEILVSSPTDPALDRSFIVPGLTLCAGVDDWSVTGRMVENCDNHVVTFSAHDGSDVHTIFSPTCTAGNFDCSSSQEGDPAYFSPSGQQVVFEETDIFYPSQTDPAMVSTRLAIAPDTATPVLTPLLAYGSPIYAPGDWR